MSRVIVPPLIALFAAAPAFAQTPATPAQPLGGPQIPGVCLLSQQGVFGNAKIGVAATARLRELAQQVDTEMAAERNALQADGKALEGQRASLKPADLQQKEQALGVRAQALQQKIQVRSREIELTREKALARIANDAQPVVATAYKAHNCGLLLDRNAVLGGNMSGDLTADVVKGLDAKITTITFERETLPPGAAAPGAAR